MCAYCSTEDANTVAKKAHIRGNHVFDGGRGAEIGSIYHLMSTSWIGRL